MLLVAGRDVVVVVTLDVAASRSASDSLGGSSSYDAVQKWGGEKNGEICI